MHWLWLSLAASIVAFSFSRRSRATVIEIVCLAFLHECGATNCTFVAYITAKFGQSTLFFFLDTFRRGQREDLIYYLLGFPSDPFHAGFQYGRNFYHYTLAAMDATEATTNRRDTCTNLTPQSVERVMSAAIKLPVGFASGSFTKDDLTKLLASCGKCHNWALVTIYQMSADKFFSYGLLSLVRWESWMLWLLLVAAWTQDQAIDWLIDPFLMAVFLFDTFNLNDALVQKGRRHKLQQHGLALSLTREVFKFFTLVAIFYCCHLFAPLSAVAQYLVLVLFSLAVALFMRLFLVVIT
jgi:hypothetical protein